jgi:hypothetical protein
MKKVILALLFLFVQLNQYAVVFAHDQKNDKKIPVGVMGSLDSYTIRGDDPNVKLGSIYYGSSRKDQVLLKTNVWGAVQFPGVHYVPLGTRLLDVLSIAGGPIERADTDKLYLSTRTEKGLEVRTISLKQAFEDKSLNPLLQADDILVIKESKFYENWNLGLSIGTFIVSAIILGYVSEDRNNK